MENNEIREPIQKRSIAKKEKIIQAGFDLICQKGYFNTNTAEIAKFAGVSTGIVYQYFKDKHDIFMEGIKKYFNSIFYPMLTIATTKFKIDNLEDIVRNMIKKFIDNHYLSKSAHEEIMAMTHTDEDVANIFHDSELELTKKITNLLILNGYNQNNLFEKVHICIGLVDNLCHEIVYHKHDNMNYDEMTNIVIDVICKLLRNK